MKRSAQASPGCSRGTPRCVHQGADVLDGAVQVGVDVVHSNHCVGRELVLEARVVDVLAHRLDVGIDRVVAEARDPVVLDESASSVQRLVPESAARLSVDGSGVSSVRKRCLQVSPPKEPRDSSYFVSRSSAEGGRDLHLAVALDVVGDSEARSDLVTPPELDGGFFWMSGPEGRDVFTLQAKPRSRVRREVGFHES